MSVGNNGSRMVGSTEFYGGLSTDNKIGIENSYADGECLDVRKSPSQMTVLPMSRKLPDSDVITGLMTAMTQSKDGNIWGIDEDGKVYINYSLEDIMTTLNCGKTKAVALLKELDSESGIGLIEKKNMGIAKASVFYVMNFICEDEATDVFTNFQKQIAKEC